MKMMIRTYSELKKLKTFEERYKYLRLGGMIGQSIFGYDRYLNQMLYRSKRWLKTRDIVIIRDKGCDLGVEGYDLHDRIIVHHMNPITIEDIENGNDDVFDPRFLICTSYNTHSAITYSNESLLPKLPIERQRYDTSPWLLKK